MRAVCLIGFAAMISIAHSSTTHADFPQLRSPSPISSLATISKTSTASIHKQRRSASASAAKKSSAPHRATKLLVVGEQASELVQLVASTRRFAGSAAASGFFIQETLDRNGREELSVVSLNGTQVTCGNANSFEPEAYESVVIPALTADARVFIIDITKHLSAFSPPSLSALSSLLRHPHALVLASLSDYLLSDPSSLASLPLRDNPAVCVVRTGGTSPQETRPPSLRAQATAVIQHLTSLLHVPPSDSPAEARTMAEDEEGGLAQALRLRRGRSRSRSPRVAMDPSQPLSRSFSPVQGGGFLAREDDLCQRSAAASLETQVRKTRAQYDRRTSQLRSKARELTQVRRGIAEQMRRWNKAKADARDQQQARGQDPAGGGAVPVGVEGMGEELEEAAQEEEDGSDDDDLGEAAQMQDAF